MVISADRKNINCSHRRFCIFELVRFLIWKVYRERLNKTLRTRFWWSRAPRLTWIVHRSFLLSIWIHNIRAKWLVVWVVDFSVQPPAEFHYHLDQPRRRKVCSIVWAHRRRVQADRRLVLARRTERGREIHKGILRGRYFRISGGLWALGYGKIRQERPSQLLVEVA
jgi:hypothetical protein